MIFDLLMNRNVAAGEISARGVAVAQLDGELVRIGTTTEIVNTNRKRNRPLMSSQFRASGKLRVIAVNV